MIPVEIRDGVVTIGWVDRVVIARRGARIDPWLIEGCVEVTGMQAASALLMFVSRVPPDAVRRIQRTLHPGGYPCVGSSDLADTLADQVGGTVTWLVVYERRIARGFRSEYKPEPPKVAAPVRTDVDHWIAFDVMDVHDRPVANVRIELLVAGGELIAMATDAKGRARCDRVRAARVVVVLPSSDAGTWSIEDGGARPERSERDVRITWHTVTSGECLTKIAARHGLKDFRVIWDHPKNAALRTRRQSPHVLRPGDVLAVPDARPAEATRTTDMLYRIRVENALAEFRVRLQDHNQLPFADEGYELSTVPPLPGGTVRGTTDADGKVMEKVPASTVHVQVRLPRSHISWTFAMSTVSAFPEPDEQGAERDRIFALQQRLNALGFPCGSPDDVLGPRTLAAAVLFQGGRETATVEDGLDSALVGAARDEYTV